MPKPPSWLLFFGSRGRQSWLRAALTSTNPKYTERVLPNFDRLNRPHITVATLLRSVPYTVKEANALIDCAPVLRKSVMSRSGDIITRILGRFGPDPNVFNPAQELNIPT